MAERRRARIFVSACLGGRPIRYNGSGVEMTDKIWERWEREARLFHFCPELAAGFPVPRPAAEIVGGTSRDVISGNGGCVIETTGRDVTGQFLEGARLAVAAAKEAGCVIAVMTDGSPSCGVGTIDAGRFDGTRIAGTGIVARLLMDEGIPVFPHTDLETAHRALIRLEAENEV